MKISTRFGFAFLCTPKCASTSVEAAIENFCNIRFSGHKKLKHLNARVYTEKILPLHQHLLPSVNIESFCLIREPVERMKSWYRYRSRKQLKNPNHPNHKNYTGNMSYEEFITSWLATDKRPRAVKLQTQYDFVRLRDGGIGVDHIMSMDRIDLLTDFLLEKTGEKINMPRKNISRRKNIELTLDKELEEKLNQHLRNDFALYELVKKHGRFEKALHAQEFSAV